MLAQLLTRRAVFDLDCDIFVGLLALFINIWYFTHIPKDVLNRYSMDKRRHANKNGALDRSTLQVMLYMFPRQFGLHNAFTHDVDPRQTVQPFQDYTLREEEIAKKFPGPVLPKVPRRLRGHAISLVQKLQVRHSRCPYHKLLQHYCPVSISFNSMDSYWQIRRREVPYLLLHQHNWVIQATVLSMWEVMLR